VAVLVSVFSSSFTALLQPLMAVSRLKRREMTTDEDVYEFRLNPALNRLLLAVLRAEVGMALAGVRRPAGDSRIVAGRPVSIFLRCKSAEESVCFLVLCTQGRRGERGCAAAFGRRPGYEDVGRVVENGPCRPTGS